MIPNRLEDRTDGHRYQKEGVESLQDLEYAGILHEQGLGKTRIGLGVALHWLRSGAVANVLVLTKKNIIDTWREEIEKHTWLEGYIIGRNPTQTSNALTGRGKVFIINYEQARNLEDTIRTWQRARHVGVILDESQAIKNPTTKTSEALMRLRDGFVRRLIMTGTIAANRPYDLWNQIRFLDGGEALDMEYDEAKRRYDLPRNDEEAVSFDERMRELHARIAEFTIRETKETAGIELPPKNVATWEAVLESRQRMLYDEYEQAAQVLIEKDGGEILDDNSQILKTLGRLVECAAYPMGVDERYDQEPGKDEVLDEVLQKRVKGRKAIIWTGFRGNAERLAARLGPGRSVVVHGGIEDEERNNRIRGFKDERNSVQLLIATPGSCKEGLTLTVAQHVIFYDRSFRLEDYEQAQDRIHRLSQIHECFVHRIIAIDTIDEWVDKLLEAKKEAASRAQGDTERLTKGFDWIGQRRLLLGILQRKDGR